MVAPLITFLAPALTGNIAAGNISSSHGIGAAGQNIPGSFSTVLSGINAGNISPELLQVIQAQGGAAKLSELLQTNDGAASAAGLLSGAGAAQHLASLTNIEPATIDSGKVVEPSLFTTSPDTNTDIIKGTTPNLDGSAGAQNSSPGNPANPSTSEVTSKGFASVELPDASGGPSKTFDTGQKISSVAQNLSSDGDSQNLQKGDSSGKEILAKIEEIIQQGKTEGVKHLVPVSVDKVTGDQKTKAENALSTATAAKENPLIEVAKNTSAEKAAASQSKIEIQTYQKNGDKNNNPNQTNSLLSQENKFVAANTKEISGVQTVTNTDTIQAQNGGATHGMDHKSSEIIKTETLINNNNRAANQTPAEQVGMRIENAVKTGETKITIQLEPGNLGKVDVKIEISHEGRTSVVVLADKAETLEILQKDSKALEKALNDSGLKTDSGSLSFGLKSQQNNQMAGEGSRAYEYSNKEGDILEELAALEGSASNIIYQSDNVLDIRV